MKKYIALKAMKFDKSYQKGTEVPENVIAKDMRNKLVRCGALTVTEIAETEEISQISEEEQQKETNQISEQEQPTKEQLLQYKKEELEQIAEQKGIEVKQSMTKTDIVALLLQEE